MLEALVFWVFSAALLLGACMTIFSRESVKSALWLASTFFASSILWIALQAEFLGLILILVYVGAIVTLFLFVIMTFSDEISVKFNLWHAIKVNILPTSLAGVWCTLMTPALYFFLKTLPGNLLQKEKVFVTQQGNNTYLLGIQLYTNYVYPIELVGVLLLAAIVVSISITSQETVEDMMQSLNQWQSIERKDRVKLVREEKSS